MEKWKHTVKDAPIILDALTNTQVTQSGVVLAVQRKIGTALYREYLRRDAAGGQRVTNEEF